MTSVETSQQEMAQRQLRALSMRNGGSTYAEIAQELSISEAQAQLDVTAAIKAAITVLLPTPSMEQEFAAAAQALTTPVVEAAAAEAPEMFRTFTDAPVVVVGEPTSDHRILVAGIDLAMRDCPEPLMWCKQSGQGHDSSYTVGVIESIVRHNDQVLVSGYLLNTPEADDAANELHHRVTSPSVDLAGAEWHYADDGGNKLDNESLIPYLESGKPLFTAITKGEIIGVTLVAKPALGSTRLSLNDEREPREAALVASAAEEFRPRIYDHTMFENPRLTRPTALTIDEHGRIYGHLAEFGKCHRSVQSECVMVPRSPSGYEHFHTSPGLRLDDGSRLSVGRLTVGTGHADTRLRPAPAAAHYDNTGSCFALVRAGEDAIGIWVSGVAAPGASAEIIEQGLTAPLSGDWRNLGQGLDLIAALAVNTPGYAVHGVDDHEGRPYALVASLSPSPNPGRPWVSREDIRSWIHADLGELLPMIALAAVDAAVDETSPAQDLVVHSEESEQVMASNSVDEKTANELIEEMLAEAGL